MEEVPRPVANGGGDEGGKAGTDAQAARKQDVHKEGAEKHLAANEEHGEREHEQADDKAGANQESQQQDAQGHEEPPRAEVNAGLEKDAANQPGPQEEGDVEHAQRGEGQINGAETETRQQQEPQEEKGDGEDNADHHGQQQEQALAQDEPQQEQEGGQQDKQQVQEEEQQAQQFSFQDGMLSCAYADLEYIPSMLGQRYGRITKRLDLTGNDLTSLSNLEEFTGLKELIADGNELSDGFSLPNLSALETLSLNKNKLTDIERLIEEIKDKTPNIRYLSLLWNVACPNELIQKEEEDYRRYRRLVLFHLPKLKFLDSSPVTQKELDEAQQVGDFLHVLRLDEDELEKQNTASGESSTFSPLPHKERQPDDHRGSIGKCRYVYYGRHSEGNRFIRDRDL